MQWEDTVFVYVSVQSSANSVNLWMPLSFAALVYKCYAV